MRNGCWRVSALGSRSPLNLDPIVALTRFALGRSNGHSLGTRSMRTRGRHVVPLNGKISIQYNRIEQGHSDGMKFA